VLNGIAALPNRHLLITGKLWPRAFEIELVPASAP
jgi:glutamine cyclotransferase